MAFEQVLQSLYFRAEVEVAGFHEFFCVFQIYFLVVLSRVQQILTILDNLIERLFLIHEVRVELVFPSIRNNH